MTLSTSSKSTSLEYGVYLTNRDVLRKLGQANSLLSSFVRIRDTVADPLTSPELANTKADLEAILEDLSDLEDLDGSVTAVESNPSRYGLSIEEIRRRRGFVEQVKDQVEDLRESATRTYNSQQVHPRLVDILSL
jgi:member of the syntaxin family of t-SNAREs